MGKVLIPIALLAAAVVAMVVADRPLPRADFTFVNGSDVSTLDLQRMSWIPDMRVARLLFEGLVRQDVLDRTMPTIPGVAESWEVSADGRTYRFHLRADARWSNGSPVTADQFVYSWRRAMLPDSAADYTGMFLLIRGGQDFFDWRVRALNDLAAGRGPFKTAESLWAETESRFERTVGLHARDERTLEVVLERPVPYFLDLCAFPPFYPVYPPLVRAYESLDPRTGRLLTERGWTKPPRLVSNGPFRLVSWRFKREMRFERNEHYWDQGRIAIDSISIPTIDDPNAAVLAFRTGAVDWVSDVIPGYRGQMLEQKRAFYEAHADRYEELRSQGMDQIQIDRLLGPDPRLNIHAFGAFATYFWNFNCSPLLADGRANPLADARVRRALAMAIDKRVIVEQIRRVGDRVAHSLVPPGSIPGYEPPEGIGFDPAAARRLLAEAGYADPSQLGTIRLLFNKDSGHDLIAQSIARNWQDDLGISVRLQQKELKVFKEDLKEHDFITARGGWFGDYGDPTTFLAINRTGDGNNDRNYSNPAFDALLDEARVELDPARRMQILSEAERIIVEQDLPLVPIFHYSQVRLFDATRITGISSHPRQTQMLAWVDVLGDGKGPDLPREPPPDSAINH